MIAESDYIPRLLDVLREPVKRQEDLCLLAESPCGDIASPPEAGLSAEMMQSAAEAIRDLPCPVQAARLAMISGVLVENGAPGSSVTRAITHRTSRTLATLRDFLARIDPEQEEVAGIDRLYDHDPDAARAYLAADLLSQAALAVLSRNKRGRLIAREIPALRANIEWLEEYLHYGYHLYELLLAVDDFPLCVIHVDQRRGYRVRVDGVRNNFHLFTLLQGILLGDPGAGWLAGPQPDRDQVAFARGERSRSAGRVDRALWTFSRWDAWTGNGICSGARWSIWGELSPREIARFHDIPAILLSSPEIERRTWAVDFIAPLHSAHRAEVQVLEHLSRAEVDNLLDRFATESAAKGPWNDAGGP